MAAESRRVIDLFSTIDNSTEINIFHYPSNLKAFCTFIFKYSQSYTDIITLNHYAFIFDNEVISFGYVPTLLCIHGTIINIMPNSISDATILGIRIAEILYF